MIFNTVTWDIIKPFDVSTLYTTIPHMLLKSRIKELIQRCFSKKKGEQCYLVIGRDKYWLVKLYSKSNNKYQQNDIIQMLIFFIDNIVVQVGGRCEGRSPAVR